jgi:hypothetical protein
MNRTIIGTPVGKGWRGFMSEDWGDPTRQGMIIYNKIMEKGIDAYLQEIVDNSTECKITNNFIYYYFLTKEEMFLYVLDKNESLLLGYVGWDEPIEVIKSQLRVMEKKGLKYERICS